MISEEEIRDWIMKDLHDEAVWDAQRARKDRARTRHIAKLKDKNPKAMELSGPLYPANYHDIIDSVFKGVLPTVINVHIAGYAYKYTPHPLFDIMYRYIYWGPFFYYREAVSEYEESEGELEIDFNFDWD